MSFPLQSARDRTQTHLGRTVACYVRIKKKYSHVLIQIFVNATFYPRFLIDELPVPQLKNKQHPDLPHTLAGAFMPVHYEFQVLIIEVTTAPCLI